jgi:hypothetical protein
MERNLADALRRLNDAAAPPSVDPSREAALLAAFDANRRAPSTRRDHWYLGAFAAAAVLFLALALPAPAGRHAIHPPDGTRASHTPPSPRDVQLAASGEFTIVPGAAGLPPMESGTLVRMDLPVSMLPSLGVTPPPGQAAVVTADLVVAQDGMPRAVRVVSP